jgi:hypothetical protein
LPEGLLREYGDEAPVGTGAELHRPRRCGEKSVITPFADVLTRMDVCPTLTYDDGPGVDELAVKDLCAKTSST